MTFHIRPAVRHVLCDTVTPVVVFLRLRDRYPNCALLESAEYQPKAHCSTYIGVNPIAEFMVSCGEIRERFPDGTKCITTVGSPAEVLPRFKAFVNSFEVKTDPEYAFLSNGLFGYVAYDGVRYFEDIEFKAAEDDARQIPDLRYSLYQFIIAIDHYRDQMYLIENQYCPGGAAPTSNQLERLQYEIEHLDFPSYSFTRRGEETSNFTDEEHAGMIEACKRHIRRGDVFQIVPSRRYRQPFEGDDFAVYRALRSINPSPYLFYFDFGSYRIFGSSPEAELLIEGRKATIHPIAGTYRRTGDVPEDERAIARLREDPKENAEHVMLVDLARNDLSKHCEAVHVESFKEVHQYSHVIHLVSRVTGTMNSDVSPVDLLADTFPAGTLSGAPKYRAMQLIDEYERGRRYFYGGAIGILAFNGSCTHAIMIRSFLSKNNVLFSQAGGGVVADSVPQSEVDEVKNKLGALKLALKKAEEL